MKKLLKPESIRRMMHDLSMEDVSPTAIMRATNKEIADAWVSYNGPIPESFYITVKS